MSELMNLLKGIEVEWKPLRLLISTVTAPAKLKRNAYSSGGKIPIIDQGGNYISGYSNENLKAVPADEYVIFGDHSEHIKYVNFSFIQGADGLKILKSKKDSTKYLYHSFMNFYQKELNYKRHWSSAKETLIPIPCPDNREKSLEIQQKIVNILDAFTELTNELTSELTARKQQFNYYREELLSFDKEEVEWKTLKSVCASISAGGDVPSNYIKGQSVPTKAFPYPIFANATGEKGLYGYADNYKIESDAVTISARGAKIGYHTVRAGKFTAIIRLIVLVPNKSIISTKFLNYALDITPIGGTKGGIPQLTVPTVKKIKIPVPSPDEQERIVSILDKFKTLTTSISGGLPKEIELRQKQYEYYRNLLLDFPKENIEV